MKLFTIVACTAAVGVACNQMASSAEEKKIHKPATELVSENMKGKIQQVVTDTYLTDSAGTMGKLESKAIETYDDNGFATSYSNYTASDSSTMLSKYEHNANGYMTAITNTKNGKPALTLKIAVDSNGKYTAATEYDSTGKLSSYYDEITQNEYGLITGAKQHHADSSVQLTFESKYDSVYYIGGESKDSLGKITYSSTVQLNDKKDPVQTEETNVTKDSTKKTTTMFTYDKWDDKGNWIQQTKTENGKPSKIIVRTITYKE